MRGKGVCVYIPWVEEVVHGKHGIKSGLNYGESWLVGSSAASRKPTPTLGNNQGDRIGTLALVGTVGNKAGRVKPQSREAKELSVTVVSSTLVVGVETREPRSKFIA